MGEQRQAQIEFPEWHAQALKEAELALVENCTHFVSWDEAKKMLRDSL